MRAATISCCGSRISTRAASRDAFIQAIFFDLKWLGLCWDEPTLRQSTRMGAYAAALEQLKAQGLVYPCFCTRAEIAAEIARAGEAQHGPDGPLYPGTCRALSKDEGLRRIGPAKAMPCGWMWPRRRR